MMVMKMVIANGQLERDFAKTVGNAMERISSE